MAVQAYADFPDFNGAVLVGGAGQGGAQMVAQIRMRQMKQVQRGRPASRVDVAPGPAGEMQHIVGAIDDHIGWRVTLNEAFGAAREGLINSTRPLRSVALLHEPAVHRSEGEIRENPLR